MERIQVVAEFPWARCCRSCCCVFNNVGVYRECHCGATTVFLLTLIPEKCHISRIKLDLVACLIRPGSIWQLTACSCFSTGPLVRVWQASKVSACLLPGAAALQFT